MTEILEIDVPAVPHEKGRKPTVEAVVIRLDMRRTVAGSVSMKLVRPANRESDFRFDPEAGYAAFKFGQGAPLASSGFTAKVELTYEGERPTRIGDPIWVAPERSVNVDPILDREWLVPPPGMVRRVPFLRFQDAKGLTRSQVSKPPEDPGVIRLRLWLILQECGRGWLSMDELCRRLAMWELDAWTMFAIERPEYRERMYGELACTLTTMDAQTADRWERALTDHQRNLRGFAQVKRDEIEALTISFFRHAAMDAQAQLANRPMPPLLLEAREEATLGRVLDFLDTWLTFWTSEAPTLAPRADRHARIDRTYMLFSEFAEGSATVYERGTRGPGSWRSVGGRPDGCFFVLFAQVALAGLRRILASADPGKANLAGWLGFLGAALAAQPRFFAAFAPNSLGKPARSLDYGPINTPTPQVLRDRALRYDQPENPNRRRVAELGSPPPGRVVEIAEVLSFVDDCRKRAASNFASAFPADLDRGGPDGG